MKRRIFTVLCLSLSAVILLTACNTGGENSAESAASGTADAVSETGAASETAGAASGNASTSEKTGCDAKTEIIETPCAYMNYLGGISNMFSNELYRYLRLEFLPSNEEIVCEINADCGAFVYYEHGRAKYKIDGKLQDTLLPAVSETPEYRKSIRLKNGETAFWKDIYAGAALPSDSLNQQFYITCVYKKGELCVGYAIVSVTAETAGWSAQIVKDVLFDKNAETGVSNEAVSAAIREALQK